LVGPSGVGKTAVIHGLADKLQRARGIHFDGEDQWSPNNLYQLSCSHFLSGTKYLGEWHSKLRTFLGYACKGTPLYVTDVWNLPHTGKATNNDANVLDGMRAAMEANEIALIGEVTPAQMRVMEKTPKFIDLFHHIHVPALTEEESFQVLSARALSMGMQLSEPSIRSLIALPRRFSSATPPPGSALQLLTHVKNYATDKARIGEATAITPLFIQRVFSIYSGLPLFVVSDETSKTSNEIRDWFRDRLIGQTKAISAVVEAITLFKAGLNDPTRPLGTFLFVGPTGVGKTELARALATFLFGSVHRLLRFDLSEFGQYDAVNRLIGHPRDPSTPAELLDPVRANPFQVILLDEIEKAHQQVWDLLLPLLDDGRLTPPGGAAVNFRNTMVICTANVGAQFANRSLGFSGAGQEGESNARILDALRAEFRPEFLNRFQHIVVFHSLNREQIRQIARLELERILIRDGITSRNLVVDVQDSAIDHVIETGYDARYGARALKREIQSRLVLPLAMALMERAPEPGSILTVTHDGDKIRVRIIDTPDSRAQAAAKRPIRLRGEKLSRADIEIGFLDLASELDAMCVSLKTGDLRARIERLESEQQSHAFWQDRGEATTRLRALEAARRVTGRLDRIGEQIQGAIHKFESSDSREAVKKMGYQLFQLRQRMARAQRELLYLGTDGYWDALVEVTPAAGDQVSSVSHLVRLYQGWADAHGADCQWLRVPMRTSEPALLLVKGHYAYGYLQGEAGLHRIVGPDGQGAARVRVIPWRDTAPALKVDFLDSRAIKGTEAYGQKIRSRLECPHGMVLQNGNTLAENQNLARELFPCWSKIDSPSTAIVRRYQLDPIHIRDAETGWSTGRTDALSGRSIHELLSLRVDRLRGGKGQPLET